jgi:hypothetical protein
VIASTCISPKVTLLPDEELRLVASNATLAKEIKELKAKLTELEAALKRKTKATTAAPKKENKAEVQQYASCWVVAAAAPDCRAHAALRTEHLACN